MSNIPPPGAPPPPPPPPGGGGFPPPPPPGPGGPPSSGEWAQPAGAPTLAYANFGQRLIAVIIDALILGVPMGVVSQIALSAVPTEIVVCDAGLCEQPTAGGWGVLGLIWVAQLAVTLWYWAEFEGNRGQTLGKKAFDIRTVDLATGQPIGAGRAIGRWFAKFLSAIPCLLGFLWMLWDDKSQTWHDKIVTSVVVRG